MDTVNIKDIARICGVGVSTVSRAINNHPDINQETKEMVMQVIQEHNYIPNNSARNLKRTDSKAIAILIKGISNPFFGRMIPVLEEEIRKNKYSLILSQVEARQDEVDVALELVKEKKPRGIVFLGGYFSHSQEKLAQLAVPFVLCTSGMVESQDEAPAYSSVSVDDFAESRRITDYLCKLGHEKILFLGAAADDESIGALRLKGYQKALEDYGIAEDDSLCIFSEDQEDCYTMENGYEMMNRVLTSGECEFSAVYGVSDSIAIGACKAIVEHGKRIPEDYSVAGFDGLDIAHFYNPSLATMRQPVEEMARASIGILFDVIQKQANHQNIVFEAELVGGESVKAAIDV